jgi:uncharacterized protein YndB with AHSA1/START domain
MSSVQLEHTPVAETGMLICKPVADVFRTFIDPRITTKFWFTMPRSPRTAFIRHVESLPDGSGNTT